MNRTFFPIIAALMLITSTVYAQDTKFFTSFEYDEEPIVFEGADLNGADGQIGLWSTEIEIPETSGGDICEPPDAVCFRNNPYEDGGRLLVVDRPGPDSELGDFRGTIDANLTDPIILLGAEVSFEIGTRRTGGNNNKDYDIIGLGSDGSESFHIRVGSHNTGAENNGSRLGYLTDDGATLQFNLPTVVGEDRHEDMNNTGYNAGLEGPGTGAEFPLVKLTLGADGFVIDFAHNELNTSADANAYVTDTLPYNGDATDLAIVQFEYDAAGATGQNSGWFLDNVTVTGFEELLQGDFDFDGMVGFSDFLILSDNFGEQTSAGDFDFNGIVDLVDFSLLKAAFGAQAQAASTAAIPEPSGLVLLALGFVSLLARRCRR